MLQPFYSYLFIAIIAFAGLILNYRMLYKCFLIDTNFTINQTEVEAIIKGMFPFASGDYIRVSRAYVDSLMDNLNPQIRKLNDLKKYIYFTSGYVVYMASFAFVINMNSVISGGMWAFMAMLLVSLSSCIFTYWRIHNNDKKKMYDAITSFLENYTSDYSARLDECIKFIQQKSIIR